VHVVATDVIGTAEAVGRDNAIALGDNFIERFTDRATQLLTSDVEQSLPADVSWAATAVKEDAIYRKHLYGSKDKTDKNKTKKKKNKNKKS